MEASIEALAQVYQFNSMVVSLALGDLDDETALKRINGKLNSIAYLAGHLISSRNDLLNVLGLSIQDDWAEKFGGGVAATDGETYPSIAEVRQVWSSVSGKLHARLDEVTDSDLAKDSQVFIPMEDRSVRSALAFYSWHESYHVGQIGSVRTGLGLDSTQVQVHAELTEQVG